MAPKPEKAAARREMDMSSKSEQVGTALRATLCDKGGRSGAHASV